MWNHRLSRLRTGYRVYIIYGATIVGYITLSGVNRGV